MFRRLSRNLVIALATFAGLLLSPRPAAANNGAKGLIKSHEYETERGGVKIALWEKFNPAEEKNWKTNGKVILLVHGATWSSRCTFDPVEGNSLMDTLAEQGYDVWALDLHGYGHSGKSSRDWTESASAAEDIDAAADYIRALRWIERVHVLGYQWGAQPAGLFAIKHPKKVHKLVLFGMRYAVVEKKAQPDSQYRINGNGNAMLKPEDGDLDVDFVRRRAQVCLQNDPKSPNGAILDLTQQSPVDPAQVKNATMLIMGANDAEPATMQDRMEFFRLLAAPTKELSVLGGLGKYANFEKRRDRFEAALIGFLDQP